MSQYIIYKGKRYQNLVFILRYSCMDIDCDETYFLETQEFFKFGHLTLNMVQHMHKV